MVTKYEPMAYKSMRLRFTRVSSVCFFHGEQIVLLFCLHGCVSPDSAG